MSVILVVNGPNLNLLGKREPETYGDKTLGDLQEYLREAASDSVELIFFQSNIEGEMIDFIQKNSEKADGLIINPGAYTHYSYAIRDAISATDIDTIEVHISNIHRREEFRQRSVIAPVCRGQISGLGFGSYIAALNYFLDKRS